MTIDKEKLKACPLCGGEPSKELKSLSEVHAYADQVVYSCKSCGISRGAMGDSSKGGYADNSTVENRAKAAWNARPEYHESLRRDAERYRWLRQYTIKSLPVAGALDSLDRQIDAAMAKEAE